MPDRCSSRIHEMSSHTTGFYKQFLSCFIVSLPMLMAGTTLGWSSPMIQYTASGKSPIHLDSSQESWMVTYIDIGNVLLSVPAGMLMDRIGRKATAYLTVPITLAGWILILVARQVSLLYVARFLHGAAMAMSLIVSPSYVGEMASTPVRGSLSLVLELTYSVGLLLSFTVGWVADYYTLAAVGAAIPVVAGVLMTFVPESPYYLMMTGKPDEAAAALRRLRDAGDESAFGRELELIRVSAAELKNGGRLTDLLNRDRTPLIIVVVLAVLQMTCGASAMESYASSVLANGWLSPDAGAVVLGVIIVVASVPFALAVDRYGRRPLYMVSCAGTVACHALTAAALSADDVTGWALLLGVCGAEFFINIGLIPLLPVVQCEYFPSDTRAMANTAAVLTVTATSAVMLKAYQPVADAYGQRANFIGYAVVTTFGGLFCYYCVPETKGKSFLQIQTDFETHDWRLRWQWRRQPGVKGSSHYERIS